MCTDSTHTHKATLRCMGKCTRVHIHIHTHEPSSRVNEVLEFLKAPPSQRQTLFYSSSHPPFFPRSSPPRVNFACGYSSLLPPFTWLSSPRSELDLNPLLGTRRCTERAKNDTCVQLDTVHLKHVSTGFIISDHRIAWCVGVQDVWLGLHLGVCMYVLMCSTSLSL